MNINKINCLNSVSGVKMSEGGYVCVPYLQNTAFATLKNTFEKSDFIDGMYFVTATFSEDGRAYFHHVQMPIFLQDSKIIPKL